METAGGKARMQFEQAAEKHSAVIPGRDEVANPESIMDINSGPAASQRPGMTADEDSATC